MQLIVGGLCFSDFVLMFNNSIWNGGRNPNWEYFVCAV